MSEYKVYVVNNYLFVENTTTADITFEGVSKDVHIWQQKKEDGNSYGFKRMSDSVILASIPYVNIKDENGDDFASESAFIEFYTTNTGQN